MIGASRPASLAMSVKYALNGRPDGAGFGCAAMLRDAIPWSWPTSCWAEAQRESKTNERRLIVIEFRFHMGFESVCVKVCRNNSAPGYFAASEGDTTNL